jgi:glucosamine-6-phosphate deaminase
MTTSVRDWSLGVFRDAAAASAAAAEVVVATIHGKPNAAISLPTGSTPLGMFDILSARVASGEIDFSNVEIFCLDEYVGVNFDDPGSLTRWLWDALLHRIGVTPEHVHALPSTAADLSTAAITYDEVISARGGLDLAVLGLGPNGHIGYNEPGSTPNSRTRVISLTPESLSQASSYWNGTVSIPDRAMTIGVGTLLESRRIVLLVTGGAKAEMLRRTLEEPMSADVPASWLRLAGPRLEVIADEEAASRLSREPST